MHTRSIRSKKKMSKMKPNEEINIIEFECTMAERGFGELSKSRLLSPPQRL